MNSSQMNSSRYAPEGKLWFCMMCGKTTKDSYGNEKGWDESCALNCILVDEKTGGPTLEQSEEFMAMRKKRIERCYEGLMALRKDIKEGISPKDFKELKELTKKVAKPLKGKRNE